MTNSPTLAALLGADDQLLLDCRYCSRPRLLSRDEALAQYGGDGTLEGANAMTSCWACDALSEFVWVSVATPADLDRIAHPGKDLVRNGRRSAKRSAPRSKRRTPEAVADKPVPRDHQLFERIRDKYRLILDADGWIEYSRRRPIAPWPPNPITLMPDAS